MVKQAGNGFQIGTGKGVDACSVGAFAVRALGQDLLGGHMKLLKGNIGNMGYLLQSVSD